MDFADYIGEATAYDKKVALERKKPRSWMKSVSAFANGQGGVLLFGVDDGGAPVGLVDIKGDSEVISELIKVRMDPNPSVDMKFASDDAGDVLLLEVHPGDETPYYYVEDGSRTAYVRIGNESVPARAADLRRLVLKGVGRTYDSVVSPYEFTDHSFTRLKSVYRSRTADSLDDRDFVSFGLAEGSALTYAGALLADDSPVRHSRVFCTRWNGLDKTSGVGEAQDDKEFGGKYHWALAGRVRFCAR